MFINKLRESTRQQALALALAVVILDERPSPSSTGEGRVLFSSHSFQGLPIAQQA